MRIRKQKKSLALVRDKYQPGRWRGAVITIGHIAHGCAPEEVPAKLKMIGDYKLDAEEMAKLVAYLESDRTRRDQVGQAVQVMHAAQPCAPRQAPTTKNPGAAANLVSKTVEPQVLVGSESRSAAQAQEPGRFVPSVPLGVHVPPQPSAATNRTRARMGGWCARASDAVVAFVRARLAVPACWLRYRRQA